MHGGLCLVDEDELTGLEPGYLTGHLASDAAGCSGDEDALALKHGAYGCHVDLYLIARQEVFNFYLAKPIVGESGFSVPFLCRGHHVDLDAGTDEGIYEGGARGEVLGLYGGYEEGTDTFLLHDGYEVVRVFIDPDSEEPGAAEAGVCADEALELITGGDFGTDALGQGNTALHAAVDEDVLVGGGTAGNIVEFLDQDADGPHAEGGQDEDIGGTLKAGNEDILGEAQVYLCLMEQAYDGAGCGIGIGQAIEIHEGGIPQETEEGVEDHEDRGERSKADQEAKGKGPEMLCQFTTSITGIEDDYAAEEHDGAVQGEDAPVGEGGTGEVPVTDFTDDIHND